MNTGKNSLAYFAEKLPNLTQTFVYREILELREKGVNSQLFSIWQQDISELSEEAKLLVPDTFYIFPVSWLRLVSINLMYFLTRPFKYISTLFFVLFQPDEPMLNRWRSLRHFVYGMKVVREFETRGISHIHAHFGWSASSIALIANRFLGIPFSITLHAHGIYIDRLLLKAKLKNALFVVTISRFNKHYLTEHFPDVCPENKIHIVHCGLDPDIFIPVSRHTAQNNNFTIVGVGQLNPRKGFHVLVEACHILKERNIPFQCIIYGEGDERGRLETLIEQHDLQGQVNLPGRITQEALREFLIGADVSVLPCIWDTTGDLDGIPVSLMETMAMEIPSVSTRVSGIPELIRHDRNGLLSEPEDAIGLADNLERLYRDSELRKRLGRAGRQTVIDEFNIHEAAERMKSLFKKYCFSDT